MQPFNLDRFKAGEPAYYKVDNSEHFYLAEFPDGRIAVKFIDCGEWGCNSYPINWLKNRLYMKEKELTWVEVRNMWLNGRVNSLSDTNLIDWLDANFEAPKRKNK